MANEMRTYVTVKSDEPRVSKKLQEIIQQMNEYGAHRVPFLFIFDFEMQLPKIYTLDVKFV